MHRKPFLILAGMILLVGLSAMLTRDKGGADSSLGQTNERDQINETNHMSDSLDSGNLSASSSVGRKGRSEVDLNRERGNSRVVGLDEVKKLRREIQQADRLSAESRILVGPRVDFPAAQNVLQSDLQSFDQSIEELRQQSLADHLASELTDLYSDYLNGGLDTPDHDFYLNDLVCGLRVCIGRSDVDQQAWRSAMDRWSQNPDAPPGFAMIDHTVRTPEGEAVEHRIIFTTDPESGAISIPFQP